MTAFDRFEQDLPELMTELAAARVPDYLDDMLRQSARTRQRPRWSALERWIPMGVIARTAPMRQVPWRSIVIAALLIVLAAAAVALFAGSQSRRLPAPFGPARNGVIATSIDGDIVTVDPVTGATKVIIGGPTTDTEPLFTNLGDKLLFTRTASGAAPAMFMANADGSNARQIIGGDTPITWLDWTPGGDRIIYTSEIDGVTTMRIVDTTTGAVTALDVGMTVHSPTLRPGHDEFVFHSDDSGSVGYYLATLDGSSVRPIAIPPGAGDQWSMSQDGSKLVYMSWADGPGLDGRLHVIDIDSGKDRLLTPIGDGYEWLNPGFSPDGTQVMADRYVATDTGQYHVVVLPVDGARPATEMGPAYDQGTDGAQKQFSPDGKSVLTMYKQDGSSWLLDAAGGPGRQLDWSYTGGPAWQRLAP